MTNRNLKEILVELANTYGLDVICIDNAHVTCVKRDGEKIIGLDDALEKLADDYTVDVTCVNNSDVIRVNRLWRRKSSIPNER